MGRTLKGWIMNRKTRTVAVALTFYLLSTLVGTAPASAAGTSQEQRLIAVFSSYQGVEARTLVFATGVINATGYETQIDGGEAPGAVGHATFHFGGGNLIATFTENNFQIHFNPVACSAAPTSQGKLIIVSGTGVYLGAKGSLNFTTVGYIVGARGADGVCLGDKAKSKSDAVLIKAVGKLTLKP
jgi:hypothetical protein